MKTFFKVATAIAILWAVLYPWAVHSSAAGATPTSPPPPHKTQKASKTPGNSDKSPKDKKKTPTPTPRPAAIYPVYSATPSPSPTLEATATLTPTLSPTATLPPGELQITVYMDANSNNLVDDGEGVEDLLLTASAGSWRAEAWTVNGVASFQVPAEWYGTNLLVQSPYLHWGSTFTAPESDSVVASGVLRLTRPDYPVYLP